MNAEEWDRLARYENLFSNVRNKTIVHEMKLDHWDYFLDGVPRVGIEPLISTRYCTKGLEIYAELSEGEDYE